MITQAWIDQRRAALQHQLREAMIQVEQLRGALALLDEVATASVVTAEEGDGVDPTAA